MDNRLTTLLMRGESLTRAEYRVLAHLTEHPLLVGNITVRQLAQATFVSTATIMRLCQKLGFSGYSEFIWHCKNLLAESLLFISFLTRKFNVLLDKGLC